MERTVTFTMEDALISPEGFMILSGAGLIEASNGKPLYQHMYETVDKANIERSGGDIVITLSNVPFYSSDELNSDNYIYVLFKKNDEIVTEPFIVKAVSGNKVTVSASGNNIQNPASATDYTATIPGVNDYDSAVVDYYVERDSGVKQIEITPDKFGGTYYLEASTLFRGQDGLDYPAEFIIPNCRVQSNFTFSMAGTGDPSTFTFTMDAFPDYTKFDRSKKVIAAIQVIDVATALDATSYREATPSVAPAVTASAASYFSEMGGPTLS